MTTTSTSNNLAYSSLSPHSRPVIIRPHMRMHTPGHGMWPYTLPTRFHFRNFGMNLIASPFTLTCTIGAFFGGTFWIATQSPFGKATINEVMKRKLAERERQAAVGGDECAPTGYFTPLLTSSQGSAPSGYFTPLSTSSQGSESSS